MATVKVILNKDRIKKNGDYSLVIQVIHKRDRRVIYSPYRLKEENFDVAAQKAVYFQGSSLSRKQVKVVNDVMGKMRKEVENIVSSLSCGNVNYITKDIVIKYKEKQDDCYLITFMDKRIAEKEKIGKCGTAKAFRSTQRSLKRFLDTRRVKFNDIDYAFVKDYENYLYGTGVVSNTVSFYLRNFRTIYNMAYDRGMEVSPNNPFRKVKIRYNKTVKRALKRDLLEKIVKLDLSGNTHLMEARDLFMFSFYTRGMSFVDIITLKHTDIVDNVIYYERNKTHQQMQVAVTEPLQRLIEKYNVDDTYVLPFINRYEHLSFYKRYQSAYGSIYRHLNTIADMLQINTPLTTYVARHSWATLAKEGGASVCAISEGLGHTTEKTTVIYLKEFDRSVVDDINERLVQFAL